MVRLHGNLLVDQREFAMPPNSTSSEPAAERQGAHAVASARDTSDMTEAEECLAEEEALTAEPADESAADKKNKLPEIPIAEVAVITCREDLDKVILRHRDWMEAVLNPKADVAHGRANLRGADLRPYDLSGVNLSGADLSGANLQGVELIGANLTVANLTNANLSCANLRLARMMRAKVEGADLRGADLTGAHLVGVDLAKAILKSDDKVAEIPAEVAPETTVAAADDVGFDAESTTEAF